MVPLKTRGHTFGSITDKAKDILEQRKLAFDQLNKVKRQLADEREFGVGEEALTWITTQVMETFFHSPHIEEVYADDATLRESAGLSTNLAFMDPAAKPVKG